MDITNLRCVVSEPGDDCFILVQLDGEYRIAQFSGLDGAPDRDGETVWEFLRRVDLAVFTERVRNLQVLTEAEVEARLLACGVDSKDWDALYANDELKLRHPQLSYKCGAHILPLVASGRVGEVELDPALPEGGLNPCAWGYVVDLDRGMFEFFTSNYYQPLVEGDRFFPLQTKDPDRQQCRYPARKLAEWPLSALPEWDDVVFEYFYNVYPDDLTEDGFYYEEWDCGEVPTTGASAPKIGRRTAVDSVPGK